MKICFCFSINFIIQFPRVRLFKKKPAFLIDWVDFDTKYYKLMYRFFNKPNIPIQRKKKKISKTALEL